MEGGRGGTGSKRGAGDHPAPGIPLPAGSCCPRDASIWMRTCGRGQDPHSRATGRMQATRGSPRRAGAAAGTGGREELSARGVVKESLYSWRVFRGEARSVGRCHPAPVKALRQRCHSPEAFGLSRSNSNSRSEPPGAGSRRGNAYTLPEGCPERQPRRDSATISASDGFSRPFPHVCLLR